MDTLGSVAERVDSQTHAPVRWHGGAFVRLGIVATILHLAILFIIIPALSTQLRPLYNQNGYADGYDELATNLAQGNGYRFHADTAPTLMREPGYPLLLAGLFLVADYSFTAVKLANVLLAFLTAWMMVLLGREVSGEKLISVLPALLFLFHPGTLVAESRGGVEVLFGCLLTAFALVLYRALRGARLPGYVLSGATLGAASLVKSTLLFFPAFLLIYLLFVERRAGRLRVVRNVGVMVLATGCVMSPWIVRNYRLTHQFVPTASVLGISAHAGQYISEHLTADAHWVELDRQAARERKQLARDLGYPFKDVKDAYYQAFYSTDDELKFSSFLLHGVIQKYRQMPGLYVRAVRMNLFNLWFAGKTWAATWINVAIQVPYLAFAAAGVIFAWRRGQSRSVGLMVLLIGYLVAVYAAILAQARYSVPMLPLLCILTCFGVLGFRRSALTHAGSEGEVTRP